MLTLRLAISVCVCGLEFLHERNNYAPFFFPGLFFYVYIESPNPKNPEGPTPQAPNPIN